MAKPVSVDSDLFRQKLKLKGLKTRLDFSNKYSKADEFLRASGLDIGKIRQQSTKLLGAGALAGTLLLAPPHGNNQLPAPNEIVKKITEGSSTLILNFPDKVLVQSLNKVLPSRPRPLSSDEEKYLEGIFNEVIGVKAKATLEGEHLNTTYGYIGAEQHLRRYPGDTLSQHSTETETLKEGMAPGLGAWGYFAPSKSDLTPDLVETEKWYAVVQTLYLPDWNKRQPYLRDWYKYRKVLIVNTENGKAVVAAIADSGPAAWTGKQFGGSPEVMEYLGGPKYKKGSVVVFFVDDPDNKVSLGPVEYNKNNILLEKT
jgi:hypothetical protein